MNKISDIMTADVQVIGPEESLQAAAQLMDQLNIGSLPVCDGRRLLGIVTDRDITIRGTAAGLTPLGNCVSDVMTTDALSCSADQEAIEVMHTMGDAQVRRVPVVDRNGDVVGIISLGDLATRQPAPIDRMVRSISAPSEPDGGAANS